MQLDEEHLVALAELNRMYRGEVEAAGLYVPPTDYAALLPRRDRPRLVWSRPSVLQPAAALRE